MKPTLQGGGFVRTRVNGEVLWTNDGGYVGTTGSGKDSTYTENQVQAQWRWFYMGMQLALQLM